MTPRLARIRIFPVKALDPVETHDVRVIGGGGLERDREFQLVDPAGEPHNGKSLGEKLMRLRSDFDLAYGELTVRNGASSLRARLPQEKVKAEAWFSEALGRPAVIQQDSHAGFPDDVEAAGPTLVSRATLETVADWFDLDLEETRRRFRANLEIDGTPAFWEDQLFGADAPRPFSIGEVRFEGVNPCARCAVPTRDSRTGKLSPPGFAKIFAERRRASLPAWAEASRFDHYYRLMVNTRIPESENGKLLTIGDEIRL
jgi:uncharacterized protein